MNAIVQKQDSLPIPADYTTPSALVALAVQQGADLQKLEKLLELERQWKADRAREAYYQALAEFKKTPVIVTKDKLNKQYGSKYTGIGNLVNTVNSAMAPLGLNARWDFKQDGDIIAVSCILAHSLGHSESVTLSGPPDASGSKNSLQQIKSTITYLEIATYQAVTGVASSDFGDDDGNGVVMRIDANQAADLKALMEEVNANTTAFLKFFKIAKLEDLGKPAFPDAVRMLEAKRKKA